MIMLPHSGSSFKCHKCSIINLFWSLLNLQEEKKAQEVQKSEDSPVAHVEPLTMAAPVEHSARTDPTGYEPRSSTNSLRPTEVRLVYYLLQYCSINRIKYEVSNIKLSNIIFLDYYIVLPLTINCH